MKLLSILLLLQGTYLHAVYFYYFSAWSIPQISLVWFQIKILYLPLKKNTCTFRVPILYIFSLFE
jgi:hypothetical protein